jgi:hypothetical protein
VVWNDRKTGLEIYYSDAGNAMSRVYYHCRTP